jgi:hypothetical protein
MIYLGYSNIEKDKIIKQYVETNNIKKIFILSPSKFYFECTHENTELIEYSNIIMYKYFYRLLQEINSTTLIVINECLRKQNRYDLTYNCIRNFLKQTNHQLIFQYIPFIDNFDDFFILFDFDTRSKWKDKKDIALLKNSSINYNRLDIKIDKINVITNEKIKKLYTKEKNKLLNNIGIKDPDTIPRNLYLFSGKFKYNYIIENNLLDKNYIGRNNRFKLKNLQTYKEDKYIYNNYIIFELCHNFIDLIDFISISKQENLNLLISDLKVDEWYYNRFSTWIKEIKNAYSSL